MNHDTYFATVAAAHAGSVTDANAALLAAGVAPYGDGFEVASTGGGCMTLYARVDSPSGYYQVWIGAAPDGNITAELPESWGWCAEWHAHDGEADQFYETFDEDTAGGTLPDAVARAAAAITTDRDENGSAR